MPKLHGSRPVLVTAAVSHPSMHVLLAPFVSATGRTAVEPKNGESAGMGVHFALPPTVLPGILISA